METVLTGFPSQNFGVFFLPPILHTQTICESWGLSLSCSEIHGFSKTFPNVISSFRATNASEPVFIFSFLCFSLFGRTLLLRQVRLLPASSTTSWLQISLRTMPLSDDQALWTCLWPSLSSLTDCLCWHWYTPSKRSLLGIIAFVVPSS